MEEYNDPTPWVNPMTGARVERPPFDGLQPVQGYIFAPRDTPESN